MRQSWFSRSRSALEFPSGPRGFATAMAVLGLSLFLALAPKLACIDQTRMGVAERHWCFSDVKALWSTRGFDVQAVPYADPPEGYPVDYVFEYPPGIAFPAYGIARLVDSRLAYFLVTAATLMASAVLITWQLAVALRAMGRPAWRLLMFAASPGLVLFAFHTWDLWSVLPAAAGLAAAARGRRTFAGALFGLGAAVKWWPALLLVSIAAGPWAASIGPRPSGNTLRWLRRWLAPFVMAAVVWALIQIPAIAVSGENWWASIHLHLTRRPNTDSLQRVLSDLGAHLWPSPFWSTDYTFWATVVSFALLFLGVLYVARRLHRTTMDPGDASLLLVVIFLLTSKVFSPQFILWLLPLAVISQVSWPRVLAVDLPNAAVWILLAGFLFQLHLFEPFVVIRALALVWLGVSVMQTSNVRAKALRSMRC